MSLVDVKYCYILDAVLLLYGFILTVLYCRLRIQSQSQKEEEPRPPKKQAPEAGIYAGLSSPNTDTYETIHAKNPNV